MAGMDPFAFLLQALLGSQGEQDSDTTTSNDSTTTTDSTTDSTTTTEQRQRSILEEFLRQMRTRANTTTGTSDTTTTGTNTGRTTNNSTGTSSQTTSTSGTSTSTSTADIAGLQDIFLKQRGGLSSADLGAIFQEGMKQAPGLQTALGNALGARTKNNSPLGTALEDLSARLTVEAANLNRGLLSDASSTAGKIADATKKISNTETGGTTVAGTTSSTSVQDTLMEMLSRVLGNTSTTSTETEEDTTDRRVNSDTTTTGTTTGTNSTTGTNTTNADGTSSTDVDTSQGINWNQLLPILLVGMGISGANGNDPTGGLLGGLLKTLTGGGGGAPTGPGSATNPAADGTSGDVGRGSGTTPGGPADGDEDSDPYVDPNLDGDNDPTTGNTADTLGGGNSISEGDIDWETFDWETFDWDTLNWDDIWGGP